MLPVTLGPFFHLPWVGGGAKGLVWSYGGQVGAEEAKAPGQLGILGCSDLKEDVKSAVPVAPGIFRMFPHFILSQAFFFLNSTSASRLRCFFSPPPPTSGHFLSDKRLEWARWPPPVVVLPGPRHGCSCLRELLSFRLLLGFQDDPSNLKPKRGDGFCFLCQKKKKKKEKASCCFCI